MSVFMEGRSAGRRVTGRGFSPREEELKRTSRARLVLSGASLAALSFCPWCFAVCKNSKEVALFWRAEQ